MSHVLGYAIRWAGVLVLLLSGFRLIMISISIAVSELHKMMSNDVDSRQQFDLKPVVAVVLVVLTSLVMIYAGPRL